MAPKTPEQYEQIRDERREQILRAGLELFARRGLAATKIGDIAKAAGVSHGLLYHYFESKEAIYVELVKSAWEDAVETALQVDALPVEPLEKLRVFTETVLGSIAGHDDAAYYHILMMQAVLSDVNPPAANPYLPHLAEPAQVLARIVTEGQAKGQIREGDVADYLNLLWAALSGLAVHRLAPYGGDKLPGADLLFRIF